MSTRKKTQIDCTMAWEKQELVDWSDRQTIIEISNDWQQSEWCETN